VSTDTVLAAIDGALADLETSADAMRWQPEPDRVICDGGRPLWPERYGVLRHESYQIYVTRFVPDWALTAASQVEPQYDGIIDFLAGPGPLDAAQHPRQHIRCNPAGNPLPLAGKYKPGPKAARMQGRRRWK
jgi:hypothetical protein